MTATGRETKGAAKDWKYIRSAPEMYNRRANFSPIDRRKMADECMHIYLD